MFNFVEIKLPNTMENNKGYVYVMINPSYDGIVKIGKTTKEPEERAKELSSATGVATPFIVVYKRLFSNCHLAEKNIHSILTDKNYRINNSREFFSINTTEAINLILSIEDQDSNYTDVELSKNDDCNLADVYYEKGKDSYYGYNGCFIDEELAISYLHKSANLGNIYAYELIGDIYNNKNNIQLALKAYKQAADSGLYWCYGKMGMIFTLSPDQEHNQHLAWDKFFQSVEEYKPFGGMPKLIDIHIWNLFHLFYFINRNSNPEIIRKYLHLFKQYKNELINYVEDSKSVTTDKSHIHRLDTFLFFLKHQLDSF